MNADNPEHKMLMIEMSTTVKGERAKKEKKYKKINKEMKKAAPKKSSTAANKAFNSLNQNMTNLQ